MTTTELLSRIDHLIAQGSEVVTTKRPSDFLTRVDTGLFYGFRTASLSFIGSLYGTSHSFYTDFKSVVDNSLENDTQRGLNILKAIRYEIEHGWLISLRQLVFADVFNDFMEMAEHLLEEGYKDAAAVMIGSVLEERLRQLCGNHGVDTHFISKGDSVPKKANLINSDLKKAGVYGSLEEKQVLTWLALRNMAAHGSYSEYSYEQVKLMYQGVLDFLSRVK